jgi:hypothetical protein
VHTLLLVLSLSLYTEVPGQQGTDSGPRTHLGKGNKPIGGATISLPRMAILNFYPSSYLSRSLATQGPKKFSLKNILLIVPPGRHYQRSGNAYHSVVGCHVAGRSMRGGPLGSDDGDPRVPTPILKLSMVGPLRGDAGGPGVPTTFLEDVDGGPSGRR